MCFCQKLQQFDRQLLNRACLPIHEVFNDKLNCFLSWWGLRVQFVRDQELRQLTEESISIIDIVLRGFPHQDLSNGFFAFQEGNFVT